MNTTATNSAHRPIAAGKRSLHVRRGSKTRSNDRVGTRISTAGGRAGNCANFFENWNRYYDPMSGRYLASEPLMVEPVNVAAACAQGQSMSTYQYATSSPTRTTDPTGLYEVDGNCNLPSKGKEKKAIENAARKLASQISNEEKVCSEADLRTCVMKQINDVKVTCNENTTIECNKPDSDHKGQTLAYATVGRCGGPSDRVFWCKRKLSADCAAEVLVHEAAHSCGWNHFDGAGVPGNDGTTSCN